MSKNFTTSGTAATGTAPAPVKKREKSGPLYKRVTNKGKKSVTLPSGTTIAAGESVVMHVSEIRGAWRQFQAGTRLETADTA